VAAKEGHASAAAEQLALLQRECAQRDDKILMLTEKVQAAQLEIKVGGSNLGRKNEELRQELAASQQALAAAQKQLEVQLLSAARGIVAVKPGIGGATKAVAGGPDTLGFFHVRGHGSNAPLPHACSPVLRVDGAPSAPVMAEHGTSRQGPPITNAGRLQSAHRRAVRARSFARGAHRRVAAVHIAEILA